MEFYLYLNPSGSSHTLSNFVVVDPPELRNLKGSWECALVELSIEVTLRQRVIDFTRAVIFWTRSSLIKTELKY